MGTIVGGDVKMQDRKFVAERPGARLLVRSNIKHTKNDERLRVQSSGLFVKNSPES